MPKEVYKGQKQKKKGQCYLTAGNLEAEKQDDFTRSTAVINHAWATTKAAGILPGALQPTQSSTARRYFLRNSIDEVTLLGAGKKAERMCPALCHLILVLENGPHVLFTGTTALLTTIDAGSPPTHPAFNFWALFLLYPVLGYIFSAVIRWRMIAETYK